MTQRFFIKLSALCIAGFASLLKAESAHPDFLSEVILEEGAEAIDPTESQAKKSNQKKSAERKPINLGSHNDYDPDLYQKYFGQKLGYDEWRALPSGVLGASPGLPPEKTYVVSLTTWPPRTRKGTPGIWITIESLMKQKHKPHRIILWLSLEEYPQGRRQLPQTLRDLEKRGLEIRFIKENIKAAKKLLPALRHIKANIITADDDIIYKPWWLKAIITSHKRHPQAIHSVYARIPLVRQGVLQPYLYCTHSKRVGEKHLFSIPVGCGGVCFPYTAQPQKPGGLSDQVFSKELIQNLGLSTDDILFFVARLLAGTPVYLVNTPDPIEQLTLNQPLFAENGAGGRNDRTIRWLLHRFPQIAKKLGVDLRKAQCVYVKPSRWERIKAKYPRFFAFFKL